MSGLSPGRARKYPDRAQELVAIGLSLDRGGWAKVIKLLAAAQRAGVHLNEELRQVVEQNDKQRFAFSDDGLRIRANQGHSIPVDLGFEPLVPPAILFHGTTARFLRSIKRQGLVPGKRNHVHLSPDERTAVSAEKRHGKPVVLTVQAGPMYENEQVLLLSEWYLVDGKGACQVHHLSRGLT